MLDDPFLPESMPLQDREEDTKEGLGRLPAPLSSISALLLFNTQENPYKKYVSLDNLAGKEVATEQQKKQRELAAAPATVTDGDQGLLQVGVIEYGYKPVLGEVPEFNLPSVLPDLPMVADISWNYLDVPEFSPIAPSTQSLAPELPDVLSDPAVQAELPVPDASVEGMAAPPPPPLPDVSVPSYDAPPLPPTNIPAPPVDAPAPPPPPPVKLGGNPTSDDRADMLADIRKGHIGRLKDAKQRKLEDAPPSISDADHQEQQDQPQPPQRQPATSTGDIFSELIMALNRRRVGLKGEAPPKKKSKKSKNKDTGEGDQIKLPEPDAEPQAEKVDEQQSSGEEDSDSSEWEE